MDSSSETYWHWIEHEGVRILEFDLRGCDGEEATRRQGMVSSYMATFPENSLLCLTIAHGVRYDPRHMSEFSRLMKTNSKYVIASAIVGLEHLTKLINVLNRLSNRSVRAFDDVEEAKDWLVGEAKN